MFAECARNGLRIAEILITYRAREDRVGALHPLSLNELRVNRRLVAAGTRIVRSRFFSAVRAVEMTATSTELNIAETSGSAF